MRRRTSSCSATTSRVGLLAKGNRALVERNSFSGLGGGGVELWNAPYEGLCASSYLIRDNVINDTNQLLRVAAPIWVEAFKAGGAVPCHADIAVHNNTIAAGPGATLALGGVAGVVVEANHITRCALALDPSPTVQAESNAHNVTFDWASNEVANATDAWLCQK